MGLGLLSVAAMMILSTLAAAAIAIGPPYGARYHCVHDGDTFWWRGGKIRIAEIDAPELNGRCEQERRLARNARARLVELLNAAPPQIDRAGKDRYGRTLARMPEISAAMIGEGLATRWPKRGDWCQ